MDYTLLFTHSFCLHCVGLRKGKLSFGGGRSLERHQYGVYREFGKHSFGKLLQG